MTAHAFLTNLRDNLEVYREKVDRLKELEAVCPKTTTQTTGDVVSGGGDPHKDDKLIRLAEEREKVAAYAQRVEEEFVRAVELLNAMPTTELRALISLRYVAGHSWKKVQRLMAQSGWQYTTRHLYRKNKEALAEAQRTWEVLYGPRP